MNKWNTPATDEAISQTTKALKENGINALVVDNLEEAKASVLKMIPEGAEVHTNTSITLEQSGLTSEVNDSGRFNATKPQLLKMDRQTQHLEMQKIGSAPEWAIGSVHAVTKDGKVIIASNSGSNLPGFAYGSTHVIWVVGSQKIVKDLEQGIKRVYNHALPLESERARKAYGVERSYVRKLLIINSDGTPNRLNLIIVKQPVGF